MKNVLLLTMEMIPSAILCGRVPLTVLADRGEIDFRWLCPDDVRTADLEWADVLVFVRSDDAMSLRVAKVARRAGKYNIYVMDDDLLNIPEGLASSEHYRRQETKTLIRQIMGECACFLTPSRNLLRKYGPEFGRAERIEEPAAARPAARERREGPVRIGFAGSMDRTGDVEAILSGALRRVLQEYPGRVTAEFFGARPALADELTLLHIPYRKSYEEYVGTMETLQWDFALAPMPDTAFHRCKHYNKYIEYASYGIPGIYSDVEPYRWAVRDGENGRLCPNTEEAWYGAMKRLIEDPALREELSRAALSEAETIYSPESAAEPWSRVISAVDAARSREKSVRYFNLVRLWEKIAHVFWKIGQYKWKTPYYVARKLWRMVSGKR